MEGRLQPVACSYLGRRSRLWDLPQPRYSLIEALGVEDAHQKARGGPLLKAGGPQQVIVSLRTANSAAVEKGEGKRHAGTGA